MLGGAPAVLADVGIDEDVVVVVSVEVVPVVPDESEVVVVDDSVVVSLSCAQAASVSEAATMATGRRRVRERACIGTSATGAGTAGV